MRTEHRRAWARAPPHSATGVHCRRTLGISLQLPGGGSEFQCTLCVPRGPPCPSPSPRLDSHDGPWQEPGGSYCPGAIACQGDGHEGAVPHSHSCCDQARKLGAGQVEIKMEKANAGVKWSALTDEGKSQRKVRAVGAR